MDNIDKTSSTTNWPTQGENAAGAAPENLRDTTPVPPLKSPHLSGDLGESNGTAINLLKIGDLLLVHRSIINGWDVPQSTRDQVCAQLGAAINHYGSDEKLATPRGQRQFLKLVKLTIAMDATNLAVKWSRPSLHPWFRERKPEKRQARRFTRKRPAMSAKTMAMIAKWRGEA